MTIDLHSEIVTLENGLRFVYLQKPSVVGHFGVTILAGSRYEKAHQEGLAHFLEHSIFKGTSKRRAYHILSRLDSVGGELNAYTTKEEICFYASFTNPYTRRAIDLLSDITQNSIFPEKEIEKEKDVVLDEINSYLDAPSDRIFDEFEAQLFTNHTLGTNILGTEGSVRSFNQKSLKEYVSDFFHASNMVVSYVGDQPLNRIKKLVEEYFGSVHRTTKSNVINEFSPPIGYKPFRSVQNVANFQVHAVIGGFAPGYNSQDERRGMTLLTNILGGPALNSRLTLSIREKYGYCYNVEANYTPYMDIGFWNVYLGTDQKNLNKSINLVYKELKMLCDKRLGVLQLNRAKEQLKGQIALSLDSNTGLMLGLGKSLLMFNEIDRISSIYNEIDKLTSSQLLEIANVYFKRENCNELIFDIDKQSEN